MMVGSAGDHEFKIASNHSGAAADLDETSSRCLLCRLQLLVPVAPALTLPGVTSDDRFWPRGANLMVCASCGHVQKLLDPSWKEDVASIYSGYSLYELSGGAEHNVFQGTSPNPRSRLLLDQINANRLLPNTGRILDFGCGSGPLLRSFGKMFPGWTLVGYEPTDRNRCDVEAIPGVESFHSGRIEDIPGTFDAIMLYFVLEHIPEPLEVIRKLKEKLRPGGLIFIVVPTYADNPFDLVVVDHCSHFTATTLGYLLHSTEVEPLIVSTKWIPRMVCGVGRNNYTRSVSTSSLENSTSTLVRVRDSVGWLGGLLRDANVVASKSHFGIFGTAAAGTWLGGAMRECVKFFVDEDLARTASGKKHFGLPVISPNEVPAASVVYLPLPDRLARGIFERLQPTYPSIRYCLPPEMREVVDLEAVRNVAT